MPSSVAIAADQTFGLCLSALAERLGLTLSPHALADAATVAATASAAQVSGVMGRCGMAVRAAQVTARDLADMPGAPPLIARAVGGGFLLVAEVDASAQAAVVFHPARDAGRVSRLPLADLAGLLAGEVFLLRPQVEVGVSGGGEGDAAAATVAVGRDLAAEAGLRPRPGGPAQEFFADAVVGVTVNRGVVRLDLASYSTLNEGPNGEPVLEPRLRLVMPIEGFVESFGMQEDLIRHLMNSGMVRKQP